MADLTAKLREFSDVQHLIHMDGCDVGMCLLEVRNERVVGSRR